MIKSLQSLRFVFAVMIFLHHFPVNGKGLFEAGGACGVSFFIILSGFVMSYGYYKKACDIHFSYKDYMLKRVIRLYPLHLLCLFSFVLLNFKSISLGTFISLIPNILLVQSWIPVKSVYFSGNAVSWCLSDMLFFYAIFPFLVRWIFLRKNNVVYIFILLLVLNWLFSWLIPDRYAHPLIYISPLFRVLDFVCGILIYVFYDEKKDSFDKYFSQVYVNFVWLFLVLFFFLGVVFILYPLIPAKYVYSFVFVLPVSLFIFINVNVSKVGFLNNPVIYNMGKVSFSFYMIHVLVIQGYNRVLDKFCWHIDWGVGLVICFFICIIASFVIYYFYEKPVANYLKKN